MLHDSDRQESSEINTVYSFALLLQACAWLAVLLILHQSYGVLSVTIGMIFFSTGDLAFSWLCANLARQSGIKVTRVSEVLTNQYVRDISVYARLRLFIVLFGAVFSLGVACVCLSLVLRSENLLLVGGLCSLVAFLKLVPVYPADGGVLVVQACRMQDPRVRIVFEFLGFVILGLVCAILFSPLLGTFFLLPPLLLPLRFNSLLVKYSLSTKLEDYISAKSQQPSEAELQEVVQRAPEMLFLELEYQEHECEWFVDSLVQAAHRNPLLPEQRHNLAVLYIATVSLQAILILLTASYFYDASAVAVNNSIELKDCKEARANLSYFRPVLELAGAYENLKSSVVVCGVDDTHDADLTLTRVVSNGEVL